MLPDGRMAFRLENPPKQLANSSPFVPIISGVSAVASESSVTVESLSSWIGELVRERQELRTHGAGADLLEPNRRRIVDLQRKLAFALIERYHPKNS
jgi:hypothetical protein